MTEVGIHCPVDLFDDLEIPYVCELSSSIDHETGQRINGFDQCPKCGLWWPCVEEPDMWDEAEDGKWIVSGWWGASVCCECNLLLVTQPDSAS